MSIKKLVDSLVAAEDMRAMWNEFSEKLINAGFEERELISYKRSAKSEKSMQNKNIVYMHPDKDVVFIFIYCSSKKIIYPVVMNKADYSMLSNSFIYLLKGRHDSVNLPEINTPSGICKLHRFVCKTTEDYFVDHIAVSGSICTRDMLRPATPQQNRIHTFKYTKVFEDYFEGTYRVTDEVKASMEKAGYKFFLDRKGDVNVYKVRSPKFEEEDAMYAALQKCERTFLKEFRYNPIKACATEKEVFLHFCKEAFGWAEKDYVEAKKYLLTKTMEDAEGLFKYYGV